MSDVVISIENLSKRYLVGHQVARWDRNATLRDVIAHEVGNFVRKAVDMVRGRQIVQGDEVEEFWALKHVTFDVKQGEVVGIIGRNGAGKSTLLKVLSRITEPTEGRVKLRGRIASLLEVGTGFHPELTGRENIYLNGAILGMTRQEIRRKFDEIVAFAEVEKFLDTPVKRYSSGMYVRLAFAVAAHLEPEILVIDEVLAVGDAEFQKKCLGKMKDVATDGRTVLFVSHNQAAISSLCSHALVMDAGRATPKLDVRSALDRFVSARETSLTSWKRPSRLQRPTVHFESIDVRLEGSQPRLRLACGARINSADGGRPVFIAVDFIDRNSLQIMQALPKCEPFIGGTPGTYMVNLMIELPPLIPGTYTLEFWIGPHNTVTYDYIRESIFIEICDSPSIGRSYPHSHDRGSVVPLSTATSEIVPASSRLSSVTAL